ncbi:hypothetical protein D187_008436 [Cystobacter fuscus DSM 2262]|uniref:Uncharacterized protein n=2 Tax=Cystobacter fuscus TaxID=43 RepID=S9QLU7_CYSF2|nr:hypothetical protein D187_008436 [Cystobacter fuscus DSM 2262]
MGVEQLSGFTPHDGKLFHSTSSKAWEGLGKAGGLVPATMLKDYDIERVTGEGDIFVPKEKGGIHCGQGDLGLGRAMAYFELTQDSSHFSPHLHTNQQLHAEIKQARHIIRNWDINGSFYHQDNSRSTLGLEQVSNRLRQLETEKALRDTMPQRPRNTEPYPMMFEFGTSNGARMLRMDRISPRIGEVAVKEPVKFEENLHRVFVPVDNLEHARGQLHRMLGSRHSVDVIPYESLQQTLHDQRNEERDPDKAYRARAALHNKAGTYKAISRSEAEIGELYDEAAATLPLRTPNY